MINGFFVSLFGTSTINALTFGLLVPALIYAIDGYDAFLPALPLIPAAALAGFSIARLYSFAGTVPNAKYSASGIWWATSQGVFSAHLMALVSTGDVMHHVIFFIVYSGISLVLMKVPEAHAQRVPEFDTVDLLLPLGAFAVLSLGAAFSDDISRASILSSVVILCARGRVGDHDNPNAPDNHRRFGIGVALFLLIFMG